MKKPLSYEEVMALPDDNMLKKIVTYIYNTPKPDYAQLERDAAECEAATRAERLAAFSNNAVPTN